MFKPFFEAVSLHREDRRGAPAALRAVVGDEGPPWDEALRDVRIRCLHLKRYGPVSRRPFFGIGRQPFAFLCEQLRVNDRGTVSRSEGLAFGQQTPVLRDKVVSAEYHVGRRFSLAGVGVDVGADKVRRLSQDEGAAVFRFADRFVARGKVGDDSRPRERVADGRRFRHPEILAYFGGEAEIPHTGAPEEQLAAEGDLLPAEPRRRVFLGSGGKPSLFIKFAVVGEVLFRDEAEQRAPVDDGGAVIQLPSVRHGKAG